MYVIATMQFSLPMFDNTDCLIGIILKTTRQAVQGVRVFTSGAYLL